ncbi:MAG: hypothetical protein ACK4F5_11240 [Aliihoeflea sp.]
MATRWTKLGLVYEPQPVHDKLASHAANPLAVHLHGDIFRVFFSGRDASNRSSVGHFDLDVAKQQIVRVCDAPDFVHGPPGSFYSHGVSIGNCYRADGSRYILFMGWQVPDKGHWRGEIGRLLLADDLSLSLDGSIPFIGLSAENPVSLSYPWVEALATGGFRMWYGSTVTWDAGNGEMLHVIRQARSDDGHGWQFEGDALPAPLGIAQAFSRPTVDRGPNGVWRMWFSYRSGTGQTYRIGEARSDDGRLWDLALDPPPLEVSDAGWDSEMIEYPFVFRHRGRLYMLYNGNGYGRSGIGLAVAEAS